MTDRAEELRAVFEPQIVRLLKSEIEGFQAALRLERVVLRYLPEDARSVRNFVSWRADAFEAEIARRRALLARAEEREVEGE